MKSLSSRLLLLSIIPISFLGCSHPAKEYVSPKSLMIINGKFFDGRPEPLPCGEPVQMGLLKDSVFGRISVVRYTPMSKAAEEFVISPENIKNGNQILKASEQVKMVPILEPCPKMKVKIGDSLPDFSLKDTKGETWTLNRLKGKRVVLNFWHTNCGPCCQEMPELSRLADKYPHNLYLAVAFEGAEKIADVVKQKGFTYHQLVNDSVLTQQIGVRLYPFTLIVNSDGIITYMQNGTSPVQMRQLEKQLALKD